MEGNEKIGMIVIGECELVIINYFFVFGGFISYLFNNFFKILVKD